MRPIALGALDRHLWTGMPACLEIPVECSGLEADCRQTGGSAASSLPPVATGGAAHGRRQTQTPARQHVLLHGYHSYPWIATPRG